jgi:hypothetical protein
VQELKWLLLVLVQELELVATAVKKPLQETCTKLAGDKQEAQRCSLKGTCRRHRFLLSCFDMSSKD